jgi:predicted ABC-class ATPase
LEGQYQYHGFVLFVDHVQGDPFASPSKIRVRVDHEVSGIPASLWSTKVRSVALRDFLTRCVSRSIKKVVQGHRGIGRSGLLFIDVGGQEVLERTSVVVTDQWVEGRLEVGLPAAGRTILGRQACDS